MLLGRPENISHIPNGKGLASSAFMGGMGGRTQQTKMGGFKNVGTDPRVKKGLGKIGIGECALDSASGNITGVSERRISEEAQGKANYRSRGVCRGSGRVPCSKRRPEKVVI